MQSLRGRSKEGKYGFFLFPWNLRREAGPLSQVFLFKPVLFLKKKGLRFLILFGKGFVLGFSISLPGISGGTMAFVLGIYEQLIRELSVFSFKYFIEKTRALFQKSASPSVSPSISPSASLPQTEKLNRAFLTPLLMGVIFAGLVFVFAASSFIKNYSLEFYSLMFGLVAASIVISLWEIKKSTKNLVLFFTAFTASALIFWAGKHFSLSLEEFSSWVLFPAGALSGLALIIPGLSGSSLLLIFGLYEKSLMAFKELDVLASALFCGGVLVGVLFSSRWVRRLLERHFEQSQAFICGLLFAGLGVIFPLSLRDFSFLEISLFPPSRLPLFLFFASVGFLSLLSPPFLFKFFSYNKKNKVHDKP